MNSLNWLLFALVATLIASLSIRTSFSAELSCSLILEFNAVRSFTSYFVLSRSVFNLNALSSATLHRSSNSFLANINAVT